MSAIGGKPQASACIACERPISPPSTQGKELFDMFCALNGATRSPRRSSIRQNAAVNQLFPTCDAVPPMNSGRAMLPLLLQPLADAIAHQFAGRAADRR